MQLQLSRRLAALRVDRGRATERALAREQHDCLWRVTGACKSTPVLALGVADELSPSINLLLAKQAALFEQRANGPHGEWHETWSRVKVHVSTAGGRRRFDISKVANPLWGLYGMASRIDSTESNGGVLDCSLCQIGDWAARTWELLTLEEGRRSPGTV